jgi:hypothetical protein
MIEVKRALSICTAWLSLPTSAPPWCTARMQRAPQFFLLSL